MSQLGEAIAPPVAHVDENPKCPFCPKEPEKPTYKTWRGEDNNSSVLEEVMGDPTTLGSKQPNARPKEGRVNQQSPTTLDQPKPNPIFSDATEGAYSCEAHHLISGKQALASSQHTFQRWICADKGTIERDTGYSVNNADNGIWAPSIPEKYKNGTWGPMSFEKKLAIAKKVMAAGHPQFHKGHHAIRDPDDPEAESHQKYDEYLIAELKAMDDRMRGWADVCPLCDNGKAPKFQPSVRANDALDRLSVIMRGMVSPPVTAWRVFLSRYALEYHKDGNCPHNVESN